MSYSSPNKHLIARQRIDDYLEVVSDNINDMSRDPLEFTTDAVNSLRSRFDVIEITDIRYAKNSDSIEVDITYEAIESLDQAVARLKKYFGESIARQSLLYRINISSLLDPLKGLTFANHFERIEFRRAIDDITRTYR